MKNTIESTEVRRRHQMAAERLLENSSLRDALTDEQAQQLLDWALAQVRQTAVRTANLPDNDAEPVLDETTTAVSQVMKQINRLVDGAGAIDEREFEDRCRQLATAVQQIKQTPPLAEKLEACRPLVARSDPQARAALFAHLIALLPPTDNQHDQA
jgi:hypothetical protein